MLILHLLFVAFEVVSELGDLLRVRLLHLLKLGIHVISLPLRVARADRSFSLVQPRLDLFNLDRLQLLVNLLLSHLNPFLRFFQLLHLVLLGKRHTAATSWSHRLLSLVQLYASFLSTAFCGPSGGCALKEIELFKEHIIVDLFF